MGARDWTDFHPEIDSRAAAARLEGRLVRTPLVSHPSPDPRIELRLKLENRQETGSFKARGATNNLLQLSEEERAAGVVACSSGNHGKALAWAARNAGVRATIVMPKDAYPNKIEACRELGADVVLSESRLAADDDAAVLEKQGWVFVHPYDRPGTVEGAGTVGVELAEEWPEVDVVIVPVGGGGLVAGTSLALRRALGDEVVVLGAEPAGAPSMQLSLEHGTPARLETIDTVVQGLCPTSTGCLNFLICAETLNGVLLLPDEDILAAQAELVRERDEVVEPAGGAGLAVVTSGHLPATLLEGRDERNPLRVAVVVSGGNPDPVQLEALRTGA